MRLFIAVNFDDVIKDALCKAMTDLANQGVKCSFSSRKNLHLTLVFIGESNRIDDIKAVMDSINMNPFTLSIHRLHTFKREDGDIVWAGIKSENTLYEIQSALTCTLIHKKFAIDTRKYTPHLTLSRKTIFPDGLDITQMLPQIKTTINYISLMKSERINGKLIYTEVYRKNLSF